MKNTFSILIVFLLIFSMVTLFIQIPQVKADTLTVSSTTSDGFILRTGSTNYATVHDAPTGTVYAGTEYSFFKIGQYRTGLEPYWIYRGFVFFDTSSIPSGATINSATLSLYISTDDSSQDFDVTIQNGQPTYPHTPLETGDYYYGWYSGNGGSRSTSEISGVGYWNITLSSDGLSWIQKGGNTKLCLRSSRDISASAPSSVAPERIYVQNREQGEGTAAKLYVTYNVGTTTSETTVTTTITSDTTTITSATTSGTTITGGATSYIVHGPYYEDGTVADAYVSATIFQPYNTSISFGLNGTDGTADDYSTILAQPASYMTWNCSSVENYTRAYYFLPTETFDEIWIFVPRTTEPFYPYTFIPADFYGMRNPYLESSINIDGTKRIVERKKADINQITFFMIQWHRYDLTWRCDQGTYTQSFSAETTFTTSLVVLAGAFPVSTSTMPTITASRPTSTSILVSYADSLGSTVWVSVEIWHYNGALKVTDYFYNETASSLSINWTAAISTIDYYVYVQAYTNGIHYDGWRFSLPANPNVTNIFAGLFDFLGTYPSGVVVANMVGVGIVLLFVAIGSFKSTGIACILAWAMFAILTLIGFITIGDATYGVPQLFLALAVSVLVFIEERKAETREV